MKKSLRTGSEIILNFLRDKNVDTVFGYPGGAVLPLYDAIYDEETLEHVLVRHEQGAVHMAEAYAKAKNEIGVALVTSGPGATNTVTGITDAFMDSIPLFVISGQVHSSMIGTDAFQEADIIGITRPITKWNYLVRHISELEEALEKAYTIALEGRQGPVLLDIPKDVFNAKIEQRDSFKNVEIKREAKENFDFSVLKEQLRNAKKPLIYFGGGVIQSAAANQLISVAEELNIPATSTLHGIGAFPTNHELYLGMLGMHGTYHANKAIDECDLLLAIGARFDDRVTGATNLFSQNSFKIHVDIDASNINKVVYADYSVNSDAKSWLSALLKLNLAKKAYKTWFDQISIWKNESQSETKASMSPRYIFTQWSKLNPLEIPVVTDVGQNQMWAAQYLRVDKSRYHITSGGLGTMGFSVPAAIGVSFAHAKGRVISVNGDGGFQMNLQELITAYHYKLPIIFIIMNNNNLGMVRQWQAFFHEKRFSFTNLSDSNPDFIRLSEAMNIPALRVQDSEEIADSIHWALKHESSPCLIEYCLEEDEMVFPMIPSNSNVKNSILTRLEEK